MAGREGNDQQEKIHYASILPSTNGHHKLQQGSPAPSKQTALERAKALYVDFDDAFLDDSTNHDYFGFQPSKESSNTKPEQKSDQKAEFYLQMVETISEMKGNNMSPSTRRQTSHENSRSSTSSDTVPSSVGKGNRVINPIASNGRRKSNDTISDADPMINMSNDFRSMNLIASNSMNGGPAPFTPDAIRLQSASKEKVDTTEYVSSEFKSVLPQYFLVKYLGRTPCAKLWGTQAVRDPIDQMVNNARKLPSMNDMPTLEICVNTRGLSLCHRQTTSNNEKESQKNPNSEKDQQGLIPLENISYVVHDSKYSKIGACIVLRQIKSEKETDKHNTANTITECYGFLFQSRDYAHRFASSISGAFASKKRSSRSNKNNHLDRREEYSPQRRARNLDYQQHEKLRIGHDDDSYLKDSEV